MNNKRINNTHTKNRLFRNPWIPAVPPRTAAFKPFSRLRLMPCFLLTNRLLLTATMLTAVLCSYAQTQAPAPPLNLTTTAVPFLSITPDARSAAMGNLGLATSPDAYSGLHNTAKTSFATDPGTLGVTYTPWLHEITQGSYLLSAAGYHKLDDNQAISASVRYFNPGDVEVSDYSGNKLSIAHPREYSIAAGYSRKLSEHLGLGLSVQYIHSDLGNGSVDGTTYKAGNAVAADISFYYNGLNTEGQGWTAGAALSNLGSRISYTNDATARDFLPANLGLGIAYTGIADEDNKWTLSAEENKLLVPKIPGDAAGLADYHQMSITKSWSKSFDNNAYQFSIGGEYSYMNTFFLRLGYCAQTQQAGDQKYITTGIGLKYEKLGLNFSYLVPSGNGLNRNPLSNTLRLGLLFSLDKKK